MELEAAPQSRISGKQDAEGDVLFFKRLWLQRKHESSRA
jgi:hypothetical protein